MITSVSAHVRRARNIAHFDLNMPRACASCPPCPKHSTKNQKSYAMYVVTRATEYLLAHVMCGVLSLNDL